MPSESRWSRLRRVFRLPRTPERSARAVDDELRFHLEERVDELVNDGVPRDHATEEVRQRFGDVEAVRHALVAIDRRRDRRLSALEVVEQLQADVAFALRTLRRRPAFAATAILTLSLGIGATTAMFSVVDGVLLQPLPFREPGQLVSIYTTFPHWKGQPVVGGGWNRLRTPFPEYTRLLQGQRSFDGIAGFSIAGGTLSLGEQTTSIVESAGTANLLPVLGVAPLLGRWFLPGEDGPAAQHLAVLSYSLWRTRFGGDRAVIGRVIVVDEQSFTVIGVLPREFSLVGKRVETSAMQDGDVWLPFGVFRNHLQAGNHTLELVGRLRPHVSAATALADIEPLLRGDRSPERRGAAIEFRSDAETREVQRPLLLLFGSVGLLLLITCGNVALLFLSECTVRAPELRTRSVLGAGRARLVRLLLTESVVIAAIGVVFGLGIGWWATKMLLALAPTDIPHAAMVGMNIRVFGFAALVGAAAAILSGIVPATTLTRADDARRGNRVVAGRSRLQTNVIAAQACMSVILMTCAGLLVRSTINEQRVNPGFRAANVLALRVDLPTSLSRDPAKRQSALDEIGTTLRALPGVARVGMTMSVPLSGRVNGQAVGFAPEMKLTEESENSVADTAYFGLMRIPILAGRAFSSEDTEDGPPVAVVNETFARRFWPNESAIGRQFRGPNGIMTVVGVVGDVKNKSLSRKPEALFYQPYSQRGSQTNYLVEATGDLAALGATAERSVWAAAPGAAVSEVTPLEALVERALAPARYRTMLAMIFAGLALLLTAVGLAGLTARGVSSRLRELCVRMALGATREKALASALSAGVFAVVAGLMLGMLVAPFAARLLADYLYGISARDVATYASTIGMAIVVCAAATLTATRRLREADLATVLRSD